jgi:Fe-S cluster assembly protein SufD
VSDTAVLDLPSAREEAWRWSDLSSLAALVEARPSVGAPSAQLVGQGGPRLVFIDGVFDEKSSEPGPLVVEALDLSTDHPLGRYATGIGWSLTIGREHAEVPIEIAHVATGGANHLPGRIILGEDAVASVTESFTGSGWSNRLTQISLARSARLMRSVRLLQDDGFVSIRDEAEIGQGASLVSIFLGAGGMDSRIDGALTLTGIGAFAEMGGALLTRDKQRQECAVVVRHEAAGGSSRQVWRAVAADQSATSLAARVEVARHAQKTDGEQSLRGLLLARTATVNLKPELEIFADDVKCAHGATVGELDARALFYLESRGIEPGRAKALMTRAFVADAIDRIGDEAAREAFAADADAWLENAL